MRNSSLAVIGGALLLIGAVGLGVVSLVGGTAFMSGPLYGSDSVSTLPEDVGERIYLSGEGENGRIRRSGGIGHMGSGGCITCHGPNGQGGTVGMMGGFTDAPPVTYEVLTGAHDTHDDDEDADAWTDSDIARAIRGGTLPDGDQLESTMPRWDMSDSDMEALIEYLKTLDEE